MKLNERLNEHIDNIIVSNYLFEKLDLIIFIAGIFFLFKFIYNMNFISTCITSALAFFFYYYLGIRLIGLLINIVTFLMMGIFFIISSIIWGIQGENDDIYVSKGFHIFYMIMSVLSMIFYGLFCIYFYCLQELPNPVFNISLLLLYGIIMLPSRLYTIEVSSSTIIFHPYLTFFYRIAFCLSLIAIFLFHINIYTLLTIIITVMAVPIIATYLSLVDDEVI